MTRSALSPLLVPQHKQAKAAERAFPGLCPTLHTWATSCPVAPGHLPLTSSKSSGLVSPAAFKGAVDGSSVVIWGMCGLPKRHSHSNWERGVCPRCRSLQGPVCLIRETHSFIHPLPPCPRSGQHALNRLLFHDTTQSPVRECLWPCSELFIISGPWEAHHFQEACPDYLPKQRVPSFSPHPAHRHFILLCLPD